MGRLLDNGLGKHTFFNSIFNFSLKNKGITVAIISNIILVTHNIDIILDSCSSWLRRDYNTEQNCLDLSDKTAVNVSLIPELYRIISPQTKQKNTQKHDIMQTILYTLCFSVLHSYAFLDNRNS